MSKAGKVLKIANVLRKKSVLVATVAAFGTASAAIAGIAYFGQNAGNLDIVVDEESESGIILSEDKNFLYTSPRLLADTISGIKPTSYDRINTEYVRNTDGNYGSESAKYIGYTFYLKNVGNETVDVQMIMTIEKVKNYVDECSRIIIFENDDNGTLYQKQEDLSTYGYTYNQLYRGYPSTTFFKNDNVIFDRTITKLAPNDVIKYSFIMWIDGNDPDCTDKGPRSIINGALKTGISFKIIKEK